MNIYDQRIAKAGSRMEDAGISLLVIMPSSDLMYLTGYSKPATDRLTTLLPTKHDSYFLCPVAKKDYFKEVDCQAAPTPWEDNGGPLKEMYSVLPAIPDISRKPCIKVAMADRIQSSCFIRLMELYPGVSWNSADNVLVSPRKSKALGEIIITRRAQDTVEKAFARLPENGLEGKTECQLSEQLMRLCLKEGLDAVGPGLIAHGLDSTSPHPILSDNKAQAEDAVMFDSGGAYKGYHANMTRICAVGYVSDEFKEAYSIVLEAHLAVLKATAPDMARRDIDLAGHSIIERAGYGAYLTHRLDHGIGLDIHELPFASASEKGVLETGNVISNEPGTYLPGQFGIRIEGLTVITEKGYEPLNTTTKELMTAQKDGQKSV